MKHRAILAVLVLILAAGAAVALEWPTGVFKPERLFGQRSAGVFESSLVLQDAETVRAAGHGRMLLTLSPGGFNGGFPGTLGDAVILVHEDGLMTIYGNLKQDSLLVEQGGIEARALIGQGGASGWARTGSLLFQVMDRQRGTLLNPLLLLPAFRDTRQPQIRNVVAVSSNGQSIALSSVRTLRQGRWALYADISDTIDGITGEFAPFRITTTINGTEQSTIPYETLRTENGRLVISSETVSSETLYRDPVRIYLGTVSLVRGRADIAIYCRDLTGNERNQSFPLIIE